MYRHGWIALCIELTVLNLLMAAIAWRLPDDQHGAHGTPHAEADHLHAPLQVIEWRVLLLSIALAMISFGYGALTSFAALYADSLQVTPRGVFLSSMAVSILAGRLFLGRSLDRIGHRRVLTRCLVLPPIGLALLAVATGRPMFVIAALVFGAGFGLMHPAYTAYVMAHVPYRRRGAAFGAMLAAFDTGIGTGSSTLGWVVQQFGFRRAFGLAAIIAAAALPAFIYAERRLGFKKPPQVDM
jgi:MFS family permease